MPVYSVVCLGVLFHVTYPSPLLTWSTTGCSQLLQWIQYTPHVWIESMTLYMEYQRFVFCYKRQFACCIPDILRRISLLITLFCRIACAQVIAA
jgi:hypothetical protein